MGNPVEGNRPPNFAPRDYVVLKRGVYIHDVYGPFILERAKLEAKQLAENDKDGYYTWEVWKTSSTGIWEKEGDRIAVYRKTSTK